MYPSVTRTVKLKLETYRSSLHHKHSVVREIVSEKTGLVVSPKVIQYPYITQKTKGLGESVQSLGLSENLLVNKKVFFCRIHGERLDEKDVTLSEMGDTQDTVMPSTSTSHTLNTATQIQQDTSVLHTQEDEEEAVIEDFDD